VDLVLTTRADWIILSAQTNNEELIMYFRYFIVKDGVAVDAARNVLVKRENAVRVIIEFRDEIGAIDAIGDSRIKSFTFKEPDLSVWKKTKTGKRYTPRKNTKAGKEMQKRINNLPIIPSGSDAILQSLNLPTGVVLFENGYVYYISAAFKKGTVFVKMPWVDKDPSEIEEYKLQKSIRTYGSCEMDYLITDIHSTMIEVKEWEFLKALNDGE
jgi:hypothetical protein